MAERRGVELAGRDPEPPVRRHTSQLHKAIDVGVAPFITKGAVVVTGWAIMRSIDETALALLPTGWHGLQEACLQLAFNLVTYLIMATVAALMAGRISTAIQSDSVVRVYIAALALFPAWKWRDVDVSGVELDRILFRDLIRRNTQAFRILQVKMFAVSLALQLLADLLLSKVKEEDSLVSHELNMIKASLGLGLAKYIHQTSQYIYGAQWDQLGFEAQRLSAFVVLLLAMQTIQISQGSRGWWRSHIMGLLLSTLCFVVGLGVHQIMCTICLQWMHHGPLLQLLVSSLMTFILGLIVGVATLIHDHSQLHDTVATLAGFNVGLTWADFCMSLYEYLFHFKLRVRHPTLWDVIDLWLFALACTLTAVLTALVVGKALQQFEREVDELCVQAEGFVEKLEHGSESEFSKDDESWASSTSESTNRYAC